MSAVAFDTHAAVRTLKNAGIEEAQAEAIVETISSAVGEPVTKDDLRNELRAFATKRDLEAFATKRDLEAFATKGDLEAFATKGDLEAFATMRDLEVFATKVDLAAFATKRDLQEFEERVMSKVQATIYRALWIQGAGILAIMIGLFSLAMLR